MDECRSEDMLRQTEVVIPSFCYTSTHLVSLVQLAETLILDKGASAMF